MDTADQAKEAARQASIGHLGRSVGFMASPKGTDYQTEDDGLWVIRPKARLTEVP